MTYKIAPIYRVAYGAITVFSIGICVLFLVTFGQVFDAEMDTYQQNTIKLLYVAVLLVFGGFAIYAGTMFFSTVTTSEEGFTIKKGFSKKFYSYRDIESVDFVRTYNEFDGGMVPIAFYFFDGKVKRFRWKYMLSFRFYEEIGHHGIQTVVVPNSKNYRA